MSTRRKFVKSGSAALIGLAATAPGVRLLANQDSNSEAQAKRRLAMVIDLDRCLGCKTCAVACKSENGVRLGGFRSHVMEKETGKYPEVTRNFLPRLCNHCENPPCQKVCPVGATYKREDGLVDINKNKCIGCRYCMVACPYGARYFNPRRDSNEAQLFPARIYGTVDKCNFCTHRVDNSVVPACVNACLANARIFGDVNDPESEIGKAKNSEQLVSLLPEFDTNPSVFYKGGHPKLFTLERKK
jgi:tetrathionate reductase subunit B